MASNPLTFTSEVESSFKSWEDLEEEPFEAFAGGQGLIGSRPAIPSRGRRAETPKQMCKVSRPPIAVEIRGREREGGVSEREREATLFQGSS